MVFTEMQSDMLYFCRVYLYSEPPLKGVSRLGKTFMFGLE